jgi:cyclopropane fatty-acyl-phospholipid synthase-like methyltransferase
MTRTPGYAVRARHYAAEISEVPRPESLADLLRPGLRVAEMPSGTGHFLPAYAAAGAEVVLIDACPTMLEAARHQACRLGAQPSLLRSRIQDLTSQAGPFDLIVMPNAALNQMTADTAAADLLTAVARPLEPGGLLLAQVLDPAKSRACGFYDPGVSDGAWHVDREFTDETGHPLTRRRRQHHHHGLIDLDFELHRDGDLLYHHRVTLRLLTTGDLRTALTISGFTSVTARPGTGGLIELLAVRSTRSPR